MWGTPVYDPNTETWTFITSYSGTNTVYDNGEYFMTDTDTGTRGYRETWSLHIPPKPVYPEPGIKDGMMHIPAKFKKVTFQYDLEMIRMVFEE